ncbi:CD5 antigen-like [Sphaeramia orbicularis]|uniref:CD5 antigen-like n=1 Tax=Sphaeramia orbicularis TaxID=375764 RepID=UPI00117C9BB2|nr:CD5 antigen-like [Sphaeramia orbicularis]
MFQCKGHESALLDCGISVLENCSSGKALELACRDPGDARLVGGASRCNGTVQVKQFKVWRDMAYVPYDFRHNPWTLKAADVICNQLDCGSAVSVRQKHASSYPLWEISPSCVEMTSTLRDCATSMSVFSESFTMFLTCSDSVRLVNGSSLCSGRLEVQSKQSWSSVCEEDFNHNDAEVVCRELGCGAPSLLQGVLYGVGEAPVWTSKLQCEGNESAVLDCRRSNSSGKTCSTGKATGLACTDPGSVRFVGQPSHCAGTLEIQHQGQWRPVIDPYQHWDLKSGSSVCQHLDCGSAVSVKRRKDSSNRLSWFVSSSCVKLTSGLRDCVGLDDSYNESSRVDVVCSDLLPQPNISLSDGFFEVYKQGFRLLMGYDFTIRCSIQPQYPGGSFQLMSNSKKAQNRTLPAVNHSAHFLLSAMGYAHQGDYICVYHLEVFNHSFSSSQSPALYLTVGVSVSHLIIRVMVFIPALLIFDISLFYYYKVTVRRIRMKADH